MEEPGLIRLFTDLTGESESAARCVIMYLDLLERDYFPRASQDDLTGTVGDQLAPSEAQAVGQELSLAPLSANGAPAVS